MLLLPLPLARMLGETRHRPPSSLSLLIAVGSMYCKTKVVRVCSNTSRPRRTRQLHEVTQGHPPWSHQDLFLQPRLRPEEELGLRLSQLGVWIRDDNLGV